MVSEAVGVAASGLRERKKQRTRATLIDAAVDLCLRQGYEQTTVEQIAAAAEVSPRTFSRYFAAKDAVFMTLIADYAEEVANELAAVPLHVGPLEAMRLAHLSVLGRVASRPAVGTVNYERVALMLRVINGSDALRQAAFGFEHDRTQLLLAQRMGVEVGDRRMRLVGSVFSAIIVTACGDLVADVDGVPLGPQVMIDRLGEAFAQVAVIAAELHQPSSYPPVLDSAVG